MLLVLVLVLAPWNAVTIVLLPGLAWAVAVAVATKVVYVYRVLVEYTKNIAVATAATVLVVMATTDDDEGTITKRMDHVNSCYVGLLGCFLVRLARLHHFDDSRSTRDYIIRSQLLA